MQTAATRLLFRGLKQGSLSAQAACELRKARHHASDLHTRLFGSVPSFRSASRPAHHAIHAAHFRSAAPASVRTV